ncbi:MAG: hypothetical protein IJN29_09305 [Akkermansia sp.]|nr:hypothetical protein [Akkermansia sp.]
MALLIEEFLGLVLRAVCVVLGLLGVAVCMVECADDPYDRLDPYSGAMEDLKYEVRIPRDEFGEVLL